MANKVYQASEASTVWTDSGGDKLLGLGNMSRLTARMGAYLDLGEPRADLYEIILKIDGFVTSPPLNTGLEIRFSQSNSTTGFDGQPTTDPTDITQGTITLEQAYNCKYIGTIRTVSTNNTDVLQARFHTRLTSRYVAPVVVSWADAFLRTNMDNHTITLTPVPQETQ